MQSVGIRYFVTTSTRTRFLVLALAALLMAVPAAAKRRSVAEKKRIALADFAAAERMNDALNARPVAQRTRRDYKRVIDAYQKVYFTAPTSSKADDSIMAVADLWAEIGERFDDDKACQTAIDNYEFLRREYPGSVHRVDALISIAEIYRDDLDDRDHARATFEDYLKHYPNGEHAKEAKAALHDMDEEERAAKSPKTSKSKLAKADRGQKGLTGDGADMNADAAPVPAKSDRDRSASVLPVAPKPDVAKADETSPDLPAQVNAAKASAGDDSDIASKPAPATSGPAVLVTGIRHWSTATYTRVAVDLGGDVTYDSDRIDHPERIYFDLHNSHLSSALTGKTIKVEDGFLHGIRIAQFQARETRVVLEVDHECEYSAFLLPNPSRLIIDIRSKRDADSERTKQVAGNMKPAQVPAVAVAKASAPAPRPRTEVPLESASVRNDIPELKAPAKLEEEDARPPRAARAEVKTAAKSKRITPEPPVHEAQPTADGDRSLIRALGLKIGRIVVDAGHGGHDTGTIGPNGLLEKDLVLDVALRLGKLLQNRMGADVVYTRDDDTFIPLETRTAIANQEQADLFISVHANSSRDASARGVETYYLNFTTSADALEVAARENAVSDQSIHQLQDLVKKIALKEKVEESREFAADVQQSMAQALKVKSRGVKKAPFIVLIGANMPSILAEISFVSNPTDAKKLKTEAYRQKIAEALYRGVAKYVEGLSGMKVAADKQAPISSAAQPPIAHRDIPGSDLP